MKRRDFARFYEKHVDRIYKFVYFRVAGNRERAEDLTQDIFTKALKAFDRYDPKISESAWIYTIARNHIINEAAKTKEMTDLADVEFKLASDWDEHAERSFDRNRVLTAIEDLPPDEADLVRLKYLEGWRYHEMAEITQKTSGALRVQMTRILKKLKEKLKHK
ncbi:sigma-70 family RNA polymerase sigma factor [Candidatus Uhrbacteria bacterium]|nr:sigma-70 family RNA polymerase sigma factor [Candidatus Uhrbacteria bacterium]MBD3284536.1 sigma-70 family RNA polymerase sigma factor [Candidatus Uhrbacteria bacterium]